MLERDEGQGRQGQGGKWNLRTWVLCGYGGLTKSITQLVNIGKGRGWIQLQLMRGEC